MPKPLEVSLPSDREIRVVRTFDAPAELVFRAWFDPALVRRWLLGPPGWSMPTCEIDGRVGGAYRYVWKNEQDGSTMGVGGIFKEVEKPTSWLATERFDEAWYDGEGLIRAELSEADGKTTYVTTMRYESNAARDKALKSGMTDGMEGSYQRLDGLLAEESVR